MLTTEQVMLESAGSTAANTFSTAPLSTDSFINAGLQIDAFDFGETSEWMQDDFWFLNEAVDGDPHAHPLC